MTLLATFVLWFRVWLVRANFGALFFIRAMSRDPPEYTKFPPQRRFTIPSTFSTRKIKIYVHEPQGFNKNKKYPVYINLHGVL
jgi:dipeptidyl aminopeptidase/acylaminoacyl peptidase